MGKILREIFSSENNRISSTRICVFIITLVSSYIAIRTTGSICTVLEHWDSYAIKPDLSHLALVAGQMAILVGSLLAPAYGLKYFQGKEESKLLNNDRNREEKPCESTPGQD